MLAPIASYTTAGVLTLVIPVAVFIVVAIWYVALWRRGMGER
jgi:hypothetical protein